MRNYTTANMRRQEEQEKMARKMLALDLDGTLTNSRKEITERTKRAIRAMQERGHVIVLASGRPTPGVLAVAKRLGLEQNGGFMLSYNGAKIHDCKTGELLYERTMPEEIVPQLFALAEEKGIGMMTYQQDGIVSGMQVDDYMRLEAGINTLEIHPYENPAEQIITPVNKCLGTAEAEYAAEMETLFRERFGEYIDVGRSEPFFLELLPKGIDKAEGLRVLCEKLGVSRDDVIACGDGFNDCSMIAFAGVGVAMANAQQVVKDAADYVTVSNDEDGVAKVIERLLEKESEGHE